MPVIESAAQLTYKGDHAPAIETLYKTLERLWKEHRTSPTRAGEELVYAFGNLDYVVVVNQDVLGALVEVKTRIGNVDCFIDEDGAVTSKLNTDAKEGGREGADQRQILEFAVRALEDYYYRKRLS